MTMPFLQRYVRDEELALSVNGNGVPQAYAAMIGPPLASARWNAGRAFMRSR